VVTRGEKYREKNPRLLKINNPIQFLNVDFSYTSTKPKATTPLPIDVKNAMTAIREK